MRQIIRLFAAISSSVTLTPVTHPDLRVLNLLALQKLDHLAFRASHECDANLYQRVLAQDGCARRNARNPARREGAGIRSFCVGHAQTEMQQGTFGPLLLQLSSPTFGLNRRPRSEHLKVTSVAGVEECSAIDAPLDRELMTNCEPETFDIEP